MPLPSDKRGHDDDYSMCYHRVAELCRGYLVRVVGEKSITLVVQGDVPMTSKSPYQRSLATLARSGNHDDGRIDEGGLHLIDGEPRK